MKKAIAFILTITIAAPLFSLLPISTSPENIITDIYNISKLFPRKEGSAAEDELLTYIKERLDLNEIPWTQTGFEDAIGYHSFSKILSAEITGEKPDTLILAVPLDSSQPEDSTGALNIALALSLLTELKNYKPPVTIQVLFLGAEAGTGDGYPLGSRHFLSSFFPDYPVAVLYLDLADSADLLNLRIGGRSVVTPRWLIERTTEALNQTALKYRVSSEEARFFRLGLGTKIPPIEPYLLQGYPAIYMEGVKSGEERDAGAWARSFFFFLSNFIEANGEGLSAGGESHYHFFRWAGNSYLLPEIGYIGFLILIPALLLLYPFFARRRFSRYLRLMGRHIWIVPAVVGIVFVFFLLGTFLIEAILRIQNTPDLWQIYPLQFFLLKISGALTLFWVTHKFLKFLPFSKRGNFYSASALLLLLTAFFIVSAINVSFSYLFLWSFFFAFLFTIFRSRFLKVLCLLASMSWIVTFAYPLFSLPQTDLLSFLLLSRVRGNALMALLLVPFIFLFIRLSFLFFSPKKRVRLWTDRGILIILASSTTIFAFSLFFSPPYPPDQVQPLILTDRIEDDGKSRILTASSPAPFFLDSLAFENRNLSLDPASRTAEFFLDTAPPEPRYNFSLTPFLNRQEIRITLPLDEETSPPVKVSVTLVSSTNESLVVLDSNFPYTLSNNNVYFHIGAHPPLPLILDFIIPGGFSPRAVIETEFSLPEKSLRQGEKNYSITTRRTFISSFRIPDESEQADKNTDIKAL